MAFPQKESLALPSAVSVIWGTNFHNDRILNAQGGGAHKHFFDRDACLRTNLNYPKKWNAPKFKPKK